MTRNLPPEAYLFYITQQLIPVVMYAAGGLTVVIIQWLARRTGQKSK